MTTTTTSTANATPTRRELVTGGIFKGAAIGAAAGAVGNALLYFGGGAAGVPLVAEFMKGQPAVPLGLGQVIVASFVPAVGAALLALLLNRLTSKPSKIFVVIAVVFSIIGMVGPATLPGAAPGLRIMLALMHIVSGVAITGGILRLGKTPNVAVRTPRA